MEMIKRSSSSLFVAMLILVSCAQQQVINPYDMQPKDLAIWANKAYISSYDAYINEYNRPVGMTESRRDALKNKKKILNTLYNNLDILNNYILMGTVPEAQITETIIELVYRLTGVY